MAVEESESEHHDLMTADEVAALSDGHTHCLVCYSDLTLRGKTLCDHNDICGVCHLRLRSLHNDNKCPICKTTNETVIVDVEPTKSFNDYPMWGEEIGAGFTHRDTVGMFFENHYYGQEILPLFGHACHSCEFRSENESNVNTNKKTNPLRLLQDHLRNEHRLALCQLCVDNKRDFVSRLPRMTPKQLQNHLRNGDGPTSGFSGHPLCEFCKPKRFYDLAFLHQHLHKEHYKCHVCEKRGLDNQFFNNYKSLERHFDQQHFLCHDVQCLAARFMVFENELDLRAHELSVHGGTSTGSTKINLEFRTRRVGYDGSGLEEQQTAPSESDFNYTLDGQAFVPEALPTSNQNSNTTTTKNLANRNNSVQLHPLHMQRTEEFRVQAAVMREQQASQSHEESFPSLQSASGSLSAPLVGWASGTTTQRVNVRKKDAGKVTTEDFPSLPTAPSAKANAKKKAITGNLGGTTRQFGAMTTAASQPHASWGGAVGSAPAVARGPSNNFLTPPAPVASVNRQTNLTADNFPSLGPSANTRQNYASANAFAKKNLQHQNNAYARAPSLNSTTDFPSIGSNSSLATKRTHQPAAAPPPSMSNVEDFPAPPSASNRNQNSVRSHILGDSSKRQPTQQAVSNVLKANVSSAVATATVEEMKASLGPNKFKQLKRLTKSFAEDQLSPEGYVDQSAALFDRGYGDSDFWSFLPSLLESCPNQGGAERAQIYMASLSHQQFARNMSSSTPAPAPSGWGGARNNNIMKGPPTAARPLTQAVSGRPNVVFPSKKKNTWGATGAATVVRAKAPPGSVAAAAAAQGPQGGTATKFMAKQEKEKKKKQNQANQPKANGKKKGSTKNELRALAFGK